MMQTSVDIATLLSVLRSFSWIGKEGLISFLLTDNNLLFFATNADIRMRRSLPIIGSGASSEPTAKGKKKGAKVEEKVEAVKTLTWVEVSYGRLTDTLKGMKGEVVLSVDGFVVRLNQEKREFKMTGGQPLDVTMKGREGVGVKVSGMLLRRGFAKAAPFVSENELRIPLMGIRLLPVENNLMMYSSDSYTLCRFKMLCHDDIGQLVPVTIPEKLASIIQDIESTTFTISQFDGGIGFAFEDGVIEGSVISESFPDVETLYTSKLKDATNLTVVSKADLKLGARLNGIYGTKTLGSSMIVYGDSEKVVLHSADPDFGIDATLCLPEPSDEMKDATVLSVNAKFLQAIIGTIDSDSIILRFGPTKNQHPMFLMPAQQHDEELCVLLMPQRLDRWESLIETLGATEVPDASAESVAA